MTSLGQSLDSMAGERKSLVNSTNLEKKRKDLIHTPSLLPIKDYESLDYDRCDNVPYKQWLDIYKKRTYFHISVMRWVMVGLIGFFTGLTAFLINVGIFYLKKLKYSQFFRVYDATYFNGTIFFGLLVLVGFNVLYAIVAGILVAIEPIAAGSGIPEIKCYLNGVRMPRVNRVRTLIAKAVGVLFSVAGGFLVGKEGPMIHSGAIIGGGIPQLRSFLWKKLKLPYSYFRSDKDKRDFVSCGAAAGVAAAFGAPIGGVLFSLEEGASFWDQGLTWRSLFCAMCSTLTLNLFLSVTPLVPNASFGELDRPGLIDFGRFYQKRDENFWTFRFLFIFIIMGAVGGLMGAWFNSLNEQLTKYRMKHVFTKHIVFKVLEAVLIAAVTSFSIFILATLLGTCVPVVHQNDLQDFVNSTRNYFCPPKGIPTSFEGNTFYEYYNDMATLVFTSEEDSIKQLFHQNGSFTLATLGLTLIVYFFIACWTYGAGVPSGLFVPCLTIGALYGRFVITLWMTIGWETPKIYAGTFALIGAAAFLGGVVRMTVSLTVILIESTDEIEYGLPLLVTLMVAKWVGDLFNEGLYDIHIELREIPLLGWDSPECMDRLNAADVMNRDLKYIYPISRVQSIERLLRVTAHNAFLVVTPLSINNNNEEYNDIETELEMDEEPKFMPRLYHRDSIHPIHPSKVIATKRKQDAKKHLYYREGATPINLTDSQHMNLLSGLTGSYQSSVTGKSEHKPLILHGVILRSQLVTLMLNGIFFNEADGPMSQPYISHQTLTEDYPRYKTVFDVNLSPAAKQSLMDVSLYMNPCPYTVSHHAPLPRVFTIFRTMGLRHLPVIEDSGIVVGIITRHDLTHEHLHNAFHKKTTHNNENGFQEEVDLFTRIKRALGCL